MNINGTSLRLDGRDEFWVGTNYYPSISWWDWLWRDFRPLKAAEDLTAMRHTGYRIVRIWLDPVLDEQSLRAADAAVYLAAQQGITPGEDLNSLMRRTVEGTLYSLIGSGPARAITLTTERKTRVTLGFDTYGPVHERATGVNFVEATGQVVIAGTPFCTIERGRAILASDDGLDLERSQRIRLLVTEPKRITFARQIRCEAVLEEGQAVPLTKFVPKAPGTSALDIDSELVRYVPRVDFEE